MPESLRCPSCNWSSEARREVLLARLRAAGFLRRRGEPDEDELRTLAAAVLDRLACPQCGETGLELTAEKETDWPGSARRCVDCRGRIEPERLELFPESQRCGACQRRHEAGESGELRDDDFCPRCGSPLALRPSGGGGLARYAMRCTNPSCR